MYRETILSIKYSSRRICFCTANENKVKTLDILMNFQLCFSITEVLNQYKKYMAFNFVGKEKDILFIRLFV